MVENYKPLETTSYKNWKGAKLTTKYNRKKKRGWGEDLGHQLPKQDRGPGRCRRKKHTADQQLDSPLDLFQYSELEAMRVPTPGRAAPETETVAPVMTPKKTPPSSAPPSWAAV